MMVAKKKLTIGMNALISIVLTITLPVSVYHLELKSSEGASSIW